VPGWAGRIHGAAAKSGSNQIGNTGVFDGIRSVGQRHQQAIQSNVDTHKPKNITGAPAASYELDITICSFKFPQVWRTNLAVDRRLPGESTARRNTSTTRTSTASLAINANLPAPTGAVPGADTTAVPVAVSQYGAEYHHGRSSRRGQSVGRSWNISETLSKTLYPASPCGARIVTVIQNTITPVRRRFLPGS
jgi:hypothetical protein